MCSIRLRNSQLFTTQPLVSLQNDAWMQKFQTNEVSIIIWLVMLPGKFASDQAIRSTPQICVVTRVVKSSQLPVKIAAYLVSIAWLLCLAFLYGWRFLNKTSLDWPLTLTTKPCTVKLSDNPEWQITSREFLRLFLRYYLTGKTLVAYSE